MMHDTELERSGYLEDLQVAEIDLHQFDGDVQRANLADACRTLRDFDLEGSRRQVSVLRRVFFGSVD